MKRVSISFVLRFRGFESAAEVEFGAHKSDRASSPERPCPARSPDSQQGLMLQAGSLSINCFCVSRFVSYSTENTVESLESFFRPQTFCYLRNYCLIPNDPTDYFFPLVRSLGCASYLYVIET
jgi:hypothetical protein